ncbi:MAG: hypothetical protein M1833_003574 [Piccolia ochrophora]|nr:MAG: hypothetical protein M1833_003574 [Piccolia ochrophora]
MGTHPEATSHEKDGRGPAEFSSVGTDLALALDHASDPVDIATAVRSAVRKGLALVDMERIDQHIDGALRRLPIRTRQSWYYADAVHSITFFLRHNQLPVGRCLCVTGLHVGIRWLAEPLIKSYLEDLVQNDYRLPPTTWETLLSRLCMSARFGPDDRRRIGAWKKKDALQILTGWPVSGVGSPGDQRDMCLASSMPMHEPEVFLHYVEALGKLGASDALWALWKSHAGSRTGEDAYPSAPAKPNTLTVNVFAKAFLAANDLSRAIHVVDPLVWGACHRPSNLEVSRWFQSRPKNTSIEDHLSNMKSALDDFVKSSRGVYMQSLDSVVDRLEDTLARDRRPV